MNSFLDSLVSRHSAPISPVQPRLRGVFEQTNNLSNPFAADTAFDLENKGNNAFIEENGGFSSIREQPFGAANNAFEDNTQSLKMRLDVQHPINPSLQKPLFSLPNLKPLTTDRADENVKTKGNEALNDLKTPFGQREYTNPISDIKSNFRRDISTSSAINSDISLVNPVENPIMPVVNAVLPVIQPVLPTAEIAANRPDVIHTRSSESSWLRDIKQAAEPFFEPTPRPVIKVTIGRIEVRAIPTVSSPPRPQSAAPKPQMSLDDYLKKRNDNSK